MKVSACTVTIAVHPYMDFTVAAPPPAGNGDIMVQSAVNNNNNVDSASSSDKSNQVATISSETGPASSSAHFSSSDPVLVPTDNSWLPGVVGVIRHKVGNQHSLGESNVVNSTMVGVGMSMEGIEQNPIVYDLMSEMAFQHQKN